MPKPKQQEIDTIYQLLTNLRLEVIGRQDIRIAA